jgi:serine/threonine-protein kinase
MKILDFGIAFMHERESPDTQIGELKGKPSYMAPEQLRAERVDRRSDLYSLSVVLHEMLTGRKLFTKNNVVATVLAVERGDVPKPSDLNPELPKHLDLTVMKGLAKNAADRYQNAREMASALDRAVLELGGEPTLERFVDQELSDEQRAHRTWMNAVLSGDFEEPGTYERFVANPDLASGPRERSITKNEKDSQDLPAEVRPLVDSTTLVPPQPTADVEALKNRSPKRTWVLAAGVLIAFLFGAIAYWSSSADVDPIPPLDIEPISTVHAEPPAPPAPVEALIEEPEPPAPEPKIAEPKRPKKKKHRKRRERPDPTPEEAAPPSPLAYGSVTIGASPYALVRIDGKEIGATPIWDRKLPVGRHEIQLVAPDTGEVRLRKIVKLEEGQHARITLE